MRDIALVRVSRHSSQLAAPGLLLVVDLVFNDGSRFVLLKPNYPLENFARSATSSTMKPSNALPFDWFLASFEPPTCLHESKLVLEFLSLEAGSGLARTGEKESSKRVQAGENA